MNILAVRSTLFPLYGYNNGNQYRCKMQFMLLYLRGKDINKQKAIKTTTTLSSLLEHLLQCKTKSNRKTLEKAHGFITVSSDIPGLTKLNEIIIVL